MTWISRSGSASAASVALWNVADSFEPMVGQTIASAPSAKQASKVSRNVPGDGAAVVGNGASGASIRAQNCSVDRSTPTRNSWSPNRTKSGTTRSPAAAAAAGARSAVESVTTATRPMTPPRSVPRPRFYGRPATTAGCRSAQRAASASSSAGPVLVRAQPPERQERHPEKEQRRDQEPVDAPRVGSDAPERGSR